MASAKRTKVDKINNDAVTLTAIPSRITYEGQVYDVLLNAWLGRWTGWVSPAGLRLAFSDWYGQLYLSPAKVANLTAEAWQDLFRFRFASILNSLGLKPGISLLPYSKDRRFKSPLWEKWPFYLYAQGFSLYEKFWDHATQDVRGVSRHHLDVVNFVVRQMLDLMSPSNYPLTNPEVIEKTIYSRGLNFVSGFRNMMDDYTRQLFKLPPAGSEAFQVGVNVATTLGKVIYRNHLIELIQYEATTTKVYSEPLLLIPAWIMKYYILDLSPHNSLVKYLVNKGHTVFMISWRNPTSEDRELSWDDYISMGVMESLAIINNILPGRKVNAVGYCLGGTLLMMAAADMAARHDNRLRSITLFASQVDYKHAGQLQLFIDPSQVTYLEDIMWEKGYLDGSQMMQAFSMLHSNDLIWSRLIHDYLLGERRPMNDLMAWDSDVTRLPYRMHSDYLHHLFLHNELTDGRFRVHKKRIALTDITAPIFAVATLTDHISPWRSVYKLYLYTKTQITFVLTSGGHNAGIVSEPGHKGRSYQMMEHKKGEKHRSPELWEATAPKYQGSWWPAWEKWLVSQSKTKIKPPRMGNPKMDYVVICSAPGTYVLQK